ncbi:DUF423 domain-containing protein [Chelativorans composti]|jgi:Uncharacterized small membrane protein|uniref:DUF423 domain-containing protein n=1 Tax=Chelativorans composti TaxID=768533 RepID=A0ABW5DDR4_9HYPH
MAGKKLVVTGAVMGGLAVALGAYGAHGLRAHVGPQELAWWQTGVQYHMWHALAVLALGLSGQAWGRLPGWLFVLGAAIFSGTLYAMALGAPRWLGAITPVGGVLMIAGWAALAWKAGRVGKLGA